MNNKNEWDQFIEPKWNIEDFYNLKYFLTTHKDPKVVDNYVNSGHDRKNIVVYNYHYPNPMPNCDAYIKSKFGFLNNVALAVNYFKPGQYLPLHVDIFKKYIDTYKVDITKIFRYILMLEDSSPGQILQIKDKCYSNWKSGNYIGWAYDEPHAFYNFSMKDRYAIQITGTLL